MGGERIFELKMAGIMAKVVAHKSKVTKKVVAKKAPKVKAAKVAKKTTPAKKIAKKPVAKGALLANKWNPLPQDNEGACKGGVCPIGGKAAKKADCKGGVCPIAPKAAKKAPAKKAAPKRKH